MRDEHGAARQRRVLHVLKFYRPDFTGEGVFLERSSAVMQELAPSVAHELLVTHTPAPDNPAATAVCSTLSRISYLANRPLREGRRHVLLAWWFARNLHRFTTVHIRTHADWYFIAYLLARLAGRRLVLSATLDDSLPTLIGWYRPRLRPVAARAFRLFHAYIGISPKLHAETVAVAVDPARCHLIPCGVTVPVAPPGQREQLRTTLGVGPDDPVLLFVGGLCARKDPLSLVEALPRIRHVHPTTRLILVGPPLEPDYARVLQDRISAQGLADAVVLVGEQLDPHPWFAAADILVFASRLEGFGTVVPEAMAHGLPVVVRRLPGVNDDFVIEGRNGYLFDDAEGLVAAVCRLAGDPALRRRLGASGRGIAADRFGMPGVAARYLGVYGLADALVDFPFIPAERRLGCSASVVDSRFHTALPAPADAVPLLITTVDAEEAFDWSQPFARDSVDVRSMASQHLAHRVFERHGVVPVYLADYPIVAQDAGRGPLRELLEGGHCDIGAQMHPWVTPPFLETVNERNSYAGNLPAPLEWEKARRLTDILGETFGAAPLIYRTGRFGAGIRTADILKRLGYLADSSVAPYWPPEAGRGHPGLWGLSAQPYWADRERTLLEIPTSAALVGHLGRRHGTRLAPIAFHPWAERLAVTGAVSWLGLLERIRLTPEGMTLPEAKRLTRAMLAAGHRVFVLTYHSPSLAPGNTPYVRTEAQLRHFLGWLDEYYAFFREELGGRCGSWRDVRQAASSGVGAPGRSTELLPAEPA